MTPEEKAKAYNEALERASKLRFQNPFDTVSQMVEYIFPELKESEDERIRKWIIDDIIYNMDNEPLNNSEYKKEAEKAISWLEKQGQQKPTLPKWKYKKDNTPLLRDSIILNKYGCVAKSPSGAIVSDAWVLDYDELTKLPKEEITKQGENPQGKSALEAANEEKVDNANKVEPKFHQGDWITNGYDTWKIVEVKPLDYILQSQDGNMVDDTISYVDGMFDSFTVQDANDGDVLYLQHDGEEHIIIYKGIVKERFRTFVSAYCAYNCIVDDFCFADVSKYGDIAYGGIMPATKEQRDLLFKKMKDAGYEWSDKDRKLIKIVK